MIVHYNNVLRLCHLMGWLLIKLFYLSNLLHMLNDHGVAHIELLGNFCSCKRINFNDCAKLVLVN